MLSTNSYLEYYLTLLGWVVNNGIWSTLVDTGVAIIPIAAIIIQEFIQARSEGADEGNKGYLSMLRVENRIYVALLVITFACIPAIPVSLSQIHFDKQASARCGVSVADPAQTGWGATFESSVGGKTASIPIWWALMHALSKGVTSASVAAIPCSPDVRQMMLELDEARINDKVLLQEVADFSHDCYGAARYRLNLNMPDINKQEDHDTGWIGSKYFLTEAGYYDTLRSHKPRSEFPYNNTRDAGLGRPANGSGYPTCTEWWNNSLRTKLVDSIEPSLLTRFQGWLSGYSNAEVTDAAIRKLISPEQQQRTMRPGQIYQEYGYSSRNESGNTITNVATNLGLGLEGFSFFPKMNAVKTSLPMIQAFLLMAIVICLPLLLVIGTYGLKTLMAVTFGLFALHMCTFWWELARWIDSSMLTALYGDVGIQYRALLSLPTMFANDATVTSAVMEFVMGALFIVLPVVFFTMMSWAGVQVGSGMANAFGNGSKEAGAAGGKAASTATNVATQKVIGKVTGRG
jgi:TraG-like protein, N-terminal region.